MPLIPVTLSRQKQESLEFWASLIYTGDFQASQGYEMMSYLQKYKRKELLIDQLIPSALAEMLTEHTSAGSQRTKLGFVVF